MKEKVKHIRRHFKRADPKLFSVLAGMDLKPMRCERDSTKYFLKLCCDIIAQQLGGKAAQPIIQRFLKLFPRGNVTPARALAFSEKELRAVGMSWAKARYVRDLAHKTHRREVLLEELPRLEDEAVVAELTKVKGIGHWTAEMFLMFTLGREDVFSLGDFGLRKGLERIYGKQRTRTPKSIEAIVSRWSPYKSYGSLALWHAIDSEAVSKLWKT